MARRPGFAERPLEFQPWTAGDLDLNLPAGWLRRLGPLDWRGGRTG